MTEQSLLWSALESAFVSTSAGMRIRRKPFQGDCAFVLQLVYVYISQSHVLSAWVVVPGFGQLDSQLVVLSDGDRQIDLDSEVCKYF
jgi:hypothetical protein